VRGAREIPRSGAEVLEREQFIERNIEEVFEFFSRAENLEAITPPWLRFRIVRQSTRAIELGTYIEYELRWRAVPIRWRTEIVVWEPPHRFVDLQIFGPYRLWHHEHRFERHDGGTLMRDIVHYQLPFGMLGKIAHTVRVRRDLRGIFDYRAAVISARFSSR
jgi:ligand-binding SRPBCC domain-containing protein